MPPSKKAKYVMPPNTPVRHRDVEGVTGVIRGHSFDHGEIWYRVDWLIDGYGPYIMRDYLVQLPSPLHLLAAQV